MVARFTAKYTTLVGIALFFFYLGDGIINILEEFNNCGRLFLLFSHNLI